MNGFIRSASYLRVSSQHQADDKTIDSQKCDVCTRAVRDQAPIDAAYQYIDDGYSGSQLARPALERLRDHVAASMIDRLYVHSPDRLARKFAHQAILLEEFDKHGCQVVFLNQDGLPDSPETKMLIQMQGMFAEYEREKILERTRRGRRHSASQGNVSVFPIAPYGYRKVNKDSVASKVSWQVEATQSETVRLMFDLVGIHGYSLASVCRELQSRGIPTKTGKLIWNSSTVRDMLVNPAYCGEARYGKERVSPRKPGRRPKRGDPSVPRQSQVSVATDASEQIVISVPPLVSKKLFEEVQQRMTENQKRQREHRAGAKYLLNGLLICGKCGSAYCHQGGKDYHYYRCIGTDKYRRGDVTLCDNASVKGGELELRVWSDLSDLLREPERLQSELLRRQTDAPELSAMIRKQETTVTDLRVRLDRMIDAYSKRLIDTEEFETRIGALRSQHDRERAALMSLRGEPFSEADPAKATAVLARLAGTLEGRLATASWDLRRDLIKLLIDRIELQEEEVRIVYKVPQNPFVPGLDNRGFFQHCLSLPEIPSG